MQIFLTFVIYQVNQFEHSQRFNQNHKAQFEEQDYQHASANDIVTFNSYI